MRRTRRAPGPMPGPNIQYQELVLKSGSFDIKHSHECDFIIRDGAVAHNTELRSPYAPALAALPAGATVHTRQRGAAMRSIRRQAA